MGFVVLGIIGPGLFQLKPPQWLGSGEEAVVEVLEPLRGGESDVALSQDADSIATATPSQIVPDDTALAAAPALPASDASPASPQIVKATPDSSGLGGPNAAAVGTQLAALKAGSVPETPAVRARIVAPKPKPSPQMVSRVARSPAVPKTAPVPVIVSRDFTRHIPDAHVGLPVKQQKESFVAMVLPLILAANEEIAQRRSAVRRAAKTKDRAGIERWAKLYRVNTDGKSLDEIEAAILLRADYVPVSLALAQAAIESGWGTSRFARQGNALFGQWAWQASAGIKPAEASNSRAVVRSFPNLFGSVRAYMHNLNTHPSYATFRERRGMMRGRQRADLGFQLATFMDSYAEIGTA